jgi:hypothetical protein
MRKTSFTRIPWLYFFPSEKKASERLQITCMLYLTKERRRDTFQQPEDKRVLLESLPALSPQLSLVSQALDKLRT